MSDEQTPEVTCGPWVDPKTGETTAFLPSEAPPEGSSGALFVARIDYELLKNRVLEFKKAIVQHNLAATRYFKAGVGNEGRKAEFEKAARYLVEAEERLNLLLEDPKR